MSLICNRFQFPCPRARPRTHPPICQHVITHTLSAARSPSRPYEIADNDPHQFNLLSQTRIAIRAPFNYVTRSASLQRCTLQETKMNDARSRVCSKSFASAVARIRVTMVMYAARAQAARAQAIGTAMRQHWNNELMYEDRHRTAGRVPLTGRALITAGFHNLRAHACVQDGTMTVALCHSMVRQTAKPGDVIICCATGPKNGFGLKIQKGVTLITHIAVVESTLGPSTYYSRVAPGWVQNRADRIYAFSLDTGLTGRTASQREGENALRSIDDGRNLVVRTCAPRGRPAHTWKCKLRCGSQCTFRLRCSHNVRFHRAGEIDHKKRLRDFRGRVLVCKSYRQFPADSDDARAVRLSDLTAMKTQIGLAVPAFGRNTKLRRAVEELFPNHRTQS